MWMRGVELRKTGKYDMNCGAADTHDNEWLCCGPVPASTIRKVMPYDGQKLHPKKTAELVMSTQSIEKYVFNWDKKQWQHNPDLTDFRPFRLERPGDKRRSDNNEAGEEAVAAEDEASNDLYEDPEPRRKRARIVRPER